MALPSSGSLSMSQVNTELGRPSRQGISLNDGQVRSLAQRPSGTISMSNLRGRSLENRINLYYSYLWFGEEGYTLSRTYQDPGWSINGYSVFGIFTEGYYWGNSYSYLIVRGYAPQNLFNSLVGWDGRTYTPTGVSPGGGVMYSFQQFGNLTYWFWYNNAYGGGLLYAPPYYNGDGTQLFIQN